jgi:hypothetical protein
MNYEALDDAYVPVLMGFILHFSHHMTHHDKNVIKKKLIYLMERCMEPEDRTYLYDPENDEVPRMKGQTISNIVTYKGYEFDLGEALKQTFHILNYENDLYRRYVIAISDATFSNFEEKMKFDYKCKKILKIAGDEYSFVLCPVGDSQINKVFPEVTYLQINELEDFVRGITGKKDGKNVSNDCEESG